MASTQKFLTGGLGRGGSPLGDLVGRSMAEWKELSVRAMRGTGFKALAPFFPDAQAYIDKVVIKVNRQRMTFVNLLINRGLTISLPNPLSWTQYEWFGQTYNANADRVMDPRSRTENFAPGLLPNRLPIYCTTSGFQLGIRDLEVSRRTGLPLDTIGVEASMRAVNENIEDAALNGTTAIDGQALTVAGFSAPGLLNATNASTFTYTTADWTTVPNGANVVAAILGGIKKLTDNFFPGPFAVLVGTTIAQGLQNDYSALKGDQTIWQRLQALEVGSDEGKNLEIVHVPRLPAGKVVIVQMTPDVIALVDGQRPTAIPWTSLDGLTIHNLILGIMVPLVRFTPDNASGIAIGTGS